MANAGNAHQIRSGVALLLACALAATAEDPAGGIAAGASYPCWVRCGCRLLLGVALVVPVAVLSLAVGEHQGGMIPTQGVALQMRARPGRACDGLRRVGLGDMRQPTYAAIAGVLCVSLAFLLLPTGWAVIKVQPWGPPWEAALIRWTALVCLGVATGCHRVARPVHSVIADMQDTPNLRWPGLAAIVGGLTAIVMTVPFATAFYLAYPGYNTLPFWFDSLEPRL